MEFISEYFEPFRDEWLNLFFITWLSIEVILLGFSAVQRRYFLWWKELVLICILILGVILARQFYYVGRIGLDFERNIQGVIFVARPSPVIWIGFALLVKRFRNMTFLFERIEKKLKRMEGDDL